MNRFHLGRGGPDLDINRQEPQPMDMGPRLRTPMPPQHSLHPHAHEPRLTPQRDRYEDEGYSQAPNAPYAQQPAPGVRLSPFTRTTAQGMSQHPGFDRHPPQPQSQSYWQGEEPYYEQPATRDGDYLSERTSPMRFIFAISGLVLIAGISWFAYRWATAGQGEPPRIQAEAGPYKVRPENPGGMSIPHQDKLIYGRLTPQNEQPVERLLPPQEQPAAAPMNVPQGYAQAVATPQEGYTPPYPPAPQGQQPQQPMAAQQPMAIQPPQGGAEGAYPSAPAPQAPYGAEGPISPSAPGAATPANYAPLPQGSAPATAPAAIAPAVPSAPQSAAAPRTPEVAAAPAPQSKPLPAAKATEAPAPTVKETKEAATTGGSFYLQMATLPNEAAAQQEGERLKKKYASQLGNVKVAVKSYNMPDGRKYRILVGPYKTKAAATTKCGEVGGSCQVKQIPG